MMIPKLAWKNIWRNKFRSLIVILAVAIGMWAGVSLMGFYTGIFDQRIETVIRSEAAHFQFHHPSFKEEEQVQFVITESEEVVGRLQNDKRVKGVSDRVIAQAMFQTTHGNSAVQLIGIDTSREMKVSDLADRIAEGRNLEGGKRIPEVLIGKKLADKYKLELKSKPVIILSDKHGKTIASALKVRGIYTATNKSLEEMQVFMSKSDLARLSSVDNAHEIAVLLHENDSMNGAVADYKKLYPQHLVESWIDVTPTMKYALDAMDTSMGIIVTIIMLALLFGIVNTMMMAVLERVQEIGMLMAIGMTKLRVFSLFVFETLMLTLVGAPLGMLLGYISIELTGKYGIDMGASLDSMQSFGFDTVIYPSLGSDKYIEVLIQIVVLTFLASLYPAFKALRLNPVNEIRKI